MNNVFKSVFFIPIVASLLNKCTLFTLDNIFKISIYNNIKHIMLPSISLFQIVRVALTPSNIPFTCKRRCFTFTAIRNTLIAVKY